MTMDRSRQHGRVPRPSAEARTWAGVVFAGSLLACAGMGLHLSGGEWELIALVAAFTAGVLLLTGIVLVVRARYRLAVRLEAEDRRLCLGCHYPLPADVAEGTCPECGRAYNLELVRRLWGDWLSSPR